MNFIKIQLLSLLFLATSVALGQPRPGPGGPMHERVKSLKIAFITEEVQLSSRRSTKLLASIQRT